MPNSSNFFAKPPDVLQRAKINEQNSYYYLMQDEDNESFLNIFSLCNAFDNVTFKFNLLKMLKKHKKDEKIKTKIMWMIKSFNSWFTKYERRLLNQQKITNEEIEKALK